MKSNRSRLLGISVFLLCLQGGAPAAIYTPTNSNGDSSAGSLHAAIGTANGTPGVFDVIALQESLGTIVLTEDLPTITDDLTIMGAGAQKTKISGNIVRRIFTIAPGVEVRIENCGLIDGNEEGGGQGGAIRCDGNLTVYRCEFEDNRASCAGAIRVNATGRLAIEESTFVGNQAALDSGAVESISAPVTVMNATFSANRAGRNGGAIGIFGSGSLSLAYSTLFENRSVGSGGAVHTAGSASLLLENSAIARNTGAAGTENLGLVSPPALAGPSFLGGDPRLRPLAYWQGPTRIHLPEIDSPLIDGGTPLNEVNVTDQRGIGRPMTARATLGSVQVSIGVVTDTNTSSNAMGTIGFWTLQNTLKTAPDRIDYIDLRGVDRLRLDGPIVLGNGTILVGAGAAHTVIGGDGDHQLLIFRDGVEGGVDGLTFENGFAENGVEGGAIESSGILTIRDCLFQNNTCTADEQRGGAAIAFTNGRARVERCTFDGNQSPHGDGAAVAANCFLEMVNCTFHQNRTLGTPGRGGAVRTTDFNAVGRTYVFRHCTFAENGVEAVGGAFAVFGGSVFLWNCFFANNSATADSATDHIFISPLGGSVFEFGTVKANGLSLPPLTYHDGNTPVLPLSEGSPAVGAGLPTLAIAFDQIGHGRPLNGLPDAGSVEYFGNDPLGAWRSRYFTEAERCNLGLEFSLWGDNADPDKDGRRNLAEAVFQTHPRVADRIEPPHELVVHSAQGGRQPQLTYRVSSPFFNAFNIRTERTSDMITWMTGGYTGGPSLLGGTVTVSERVVTPIPDGGQHYMRVSIDGSRVPQAVIPFVTVGAPGNTDKQGTSYGGVSYPYMISKFEITNAQWAAFLNAVDPSGANTLGLWNSDSSIMRTDFALPGHKYTAAIFSDLVPVTYASIYDAMRFCNWLHHGALPGGTTESGAYALLGGTPVPSNAGSITRDPAARYALPTISEWYKAGHYDPDTGYALYPQGQATINNDAPPGGNASAHIDEPTGFPRPVGSYPSATSPWGCFDMAGNVGEWSETMDQAEHYVHGGNSRSAVSAASTPDGNLEMPTAEKFQLGCRIVRLR